MPPSVLLTPELNSLLFASVICGLLAIFFMLGILWNEVDFAARMKRLAVFFWQSGFKVGIGIAPRTRDDWWRFKLRKKQ